MFGKDPNCVKCGKEMKGDEVVLVKMRYPRRKMKEVSSAKLVLIRKFNSVEWIVNSNQED